MISIGGVIGTGLFLGTGGALANGGPLGLLLGYCIMGAVCMSVMLGLGESESSSFNFERHQRSDPCIDVDLTVPTRFFFAPVVSDLVPAYRGRSYRSRPPIRRSRLVLCTLSQLRLQVRAFCLFARG
jgi:hypothetical protein